MAEPTDTVITDEKDDGTFSQISRNYNQIRKSATTFLFGKVLGGENVTPGDHDVTFFGLSLIMILYDTFVAKRREMAPEASMSIEEYIGYLFIRSVVAFLFPKQFFLIFSVYILVQIVTQDSTPNIPIFFH